MFRLQRIRRLSLATALLTILLLLSSLSASAAPQRPATLITARSSFQDNAQTQRLRQLLRAGQLAPSVAVLDSLPPTTIVQFPLVPSGVKQAFPKASGLVTILRSQRDDSTSDVVTVDVQNMPPDITFTIFFIEIANKPFGHVEYVADLTTREDGSGESIFHLISLVAFTMDARDPGSSQDQEGLAPGIQLEHMGMWFASLKDAQTVLKDTTLKGTIFDGGSPPLHAGPQALTDGQDAPVF